ncbi:MFS transporter [Streptomyces sp. NPDC004539]|uniref:MFS transporter n=1 Tax=Streptomyces sp. NPDC004539 TaxID=3154280 RepID=UPI0033A64FF9
MWAVGFSVFVVTTTEMMPVGLLPKISGDLDVSVGTAGIAVTAFGLIAGLSAPVATVLGSRMDRRTLLLMILAVFTVGNSVAAVSQTYWLFIVSRIATGMLHGLMWSIVATIAIRLVAAKDGVKATSIAFSGISIALVLGVPFGSLLGNLSGWRSAFASLAVLSGVTLLVIRMLVPELPSQSVLRVRDFGPLVRSRALLGALLVTFVVVVGNYAAYTYISPFLSDSRGVSLSMIGPFLLVYGISGVFGNFLAGHVLSRSRSVSTVLGGLGLIVTTALALLLVLDVRVGVIVLLVVWGMAYSGIPVVLQTLVLRSGGENGQAAASIYVLVFNASIAMGALVGGVAIDSRGPAAPILVGAVFCAVSVLANVTIIRGTAADRN